MKSKLLLAVALALGVSTSAMAAPTFSLKNTAGWDGSFEIKFTNYEAFLSTDATGATVASLGPSVGAENIGILRVTSIERQDGGGAVWQDGDNGAEILGIFNGIDVASITPVTATDFKVASTGGILNMYINPYTSFGAAGAFGQGLLGYGNASCTIGTLCYNGISNVAGGGLFLTADFVPGVLDAAGDTTTTVNGDFNALTTPASGGAQSYLSVTGGSHAATFDTNGFTFTNNAPADLFSQNDFCTPGDTGCVTLASGGGAPGSGLISDITASTDHGWLLKSNDPVRGTIPEPGTLALLGIGLLGMGFARRRRA